MTYNIDPELLPILDLIPPTNFGDPNVARRDLSTIMKVLGSSIDESGLTIEDATIPGVDGQPDAAIRIYSPTDLKIPTAGLIYIHAGGWIIGSVDTEHAVVVDLCRDLGVVIISVDYRLAPECPFPAGLEDCYSALFWTHKNASNLNIDVTRIGVMGSSAGGGLAAGLALLARDRHGPKLCYQVLDIPGLDDRLTNCSTTAFTDTPLLDRSALKHCWKFYLGEAHAPGSDKVPYYAAPSRASVEELANLPPAYVSTMEFDPLRDEGIEYALRLLQAGVNVELHSFPGTFHGSGFAAQAAVSVRAKNELKTALSRGLSLE